MLALSPAGEISREKLAGTLWGNKPDGQARNSLRQCLRELRDVFNTGADRLAIDARRVGLRLDVVSVDVREIVALADRAHDAPDDVAALYGGRLLDGDLPDDGAFDEWLHSERMCWDARIRGVFESVLRAQLSRRQWPAMERTAIALLQIDAAHEEAHRALMEAFGARGDVAAAMRQYRLLKSALEREYGASPSSATAEVYARLRAAQSERLAGAATAEAVAPEAARIGGGQTVPSRSGRAVPITVLPLLEDGVDGRHTRSLGAGIGEAIVAALSRFRTLVIVSSGTFGEVSPSRPMPEPAEVGRQLGVSYFVRGRVRSADTRIRIFVELVECARGLIVWADRFEGTLESVFDFEDDVAARIVGRLDPMIVRSESERVSRYRPQDLAAYELVMLSIPAIYRAERATFEPAGRALLRAIELDPSYSDAYAFRAFWCMHSVGQGWHPSPEAAIVEAADGANLAIALDPTNAMALAVAGHVESFLYRRLDHGARLLARSLAINPNSGFAWAMSAVLACYRGEPLGALERMAQYRRLCPFDPGGCYFGTIDVIANTVLHRFDEAIALGAAVVRENASFSNAWKPLITSLWHAGRIEDARDAARRLLALEPDFSVEKFRRVYPFSRPGDVALYVDAFRGVGIPEGPVARSSE